MRIEANFLRTNSENFQFASIRIFSRVSVSKFVAFVLVILRDVFLFKGITGRYSPPREGLF